MITLIQFGAAELTTTYFYTNAEAGTLNPTLVHIYSFFLWFVTALLFYVPDLIVEYYLIRCIRPLGRGKPIGHRALRYVWYVSAAESLVHFVRRFISVVSTNDLYDELTKPRDFFNNVFDTYPPEAPALSISPWTIISWAISLAFAVCMIRVTVKLNRQQTSKKKVLKAAVSKAPSRDFWDLE
ncbi:MAG: hypothetical protein FWG82_06250 [Oscillospiraceae bacterium]|nr:hypothetical protein [Oscillospiraceae bacterium]